MSVQMVRPQDESISDKHEREKARKREYNKHYKNAHPYVRQMKTISSMKYIARLRKDKKRLRELDERYEQLKKLRDEWRMAQHESGYEQKELAESADAQKSSSIK